MIGTCVPKAEKTCRVRTSKSLTYTTGTTSNTTYAACCYTGRRLDPETGNYYYRNRYYSADLGRFVSRDPIGHLELMRQLSRKLLRNLSKRRRQSRLPRGSSYVDGMNLYAGYFVPNKADPLGLLDAPTEPPEDPETPPGEDEGVMSQWVSGEDIYCKGKGYSAAREWCCRIGYRILMKLGGASAKQGECMVSWKACIADCTVTYGDNSGELLWCWFDCHLNYAACIK